MTPCYITAPYCSGSLELKCALHPNILYSILSKKGAWLSEETKQPEGTFDRTRGQPRMVCGAISRGFRLWYVIQANSFCLIRSQIFKRQLSLEATFYIQNSRENSLKPGPSHSTKGRVNRSCLKRFLRVTHCWRVPGTSVLSGRAI